MKKLLLLLIIPLLFSCEGKRKPFVGTWNFIAVGNLEGIAIFNEDETMVIKYYGGEFIIDGTGLISDEASYGYQERGQWKIDNNNSLCFFNMTNYFSDRKSEKKWEECGAYTWDGENKFTANFNFPTIFLRNTNLDKDFFNLFLKDSKKIEDWSIYYPQLYEEEKKYINSLQ